MFPNSFSLGPPPFPSKHQQQSNLFHIIPANVSPTLVSHQRTLVPPLNFHTATVLLNGNLATFPTATSNGTQQPMTYGNDSSPSTSDALTSFQGRKRQSEQSASCNIKRQRIDSLKSDSTVVKQAVPLPAERRHSFPGPISTQSPSFLRRGSPALAGCVPRLQDVFLPDPTDARLPLAKDELSRQVLELFQGYRQQASDLNRKELCRTELQREIQLIFPRSRLYLVGSSLNGFGTRSSDGDLCLIVKEEPVNQKTEARRILTLVLKLFTTKLSNYIEGPQLIKAKVPIVKFRDKVSYMEFDLNVNNIVGIRNTFLLRTYAFIENRVRPLVLVVKKWASCHEINDASRGTLSSYSLVLMVLHYLQTLPEPILPSLQKNYPECFDPTMELHLVHQAPCCIPPYISKNRSSLGDLLIGFFKYYATEFDWSRQMISVREAKALPRPDGVEWRNKFICVEEPFDGTNTARAVHEKQKFDMIRGEFAQAWRLLRDKRDLKYIVPVRAYELKR